MAQQTNAAGAQQVGNNPGGADFPAGGQQQQQQVQANRAAAVAKQ